MRGSSLYTARPRVARVGRADALWLSSAYAVEEELAAGSLVELLRATQHVEVTLYTLRRRDPTPLAKAIAAALRERVEVLSKLCR